MSEELFKVPVSKSPRLRWMEKHHVTVERMPVEVNPGDEDEFSHEMFQFYASDDGRHRYGGNTEDEALAKYASCRGYRLWNEEGYDNR
jgi:hypothetical protein